MSFKANIAIVLHFHAFKNIALPHKARYALKSTIYQGKAQKVIAMPFNIVATQAKLKKNVSAQGQIQDTFFITKKFNIEYQEQEIELNDCCQFRLILQGFPQLRDQQLYLQITLIENIACYFREEMNSKITMKEAETYRFKIQNVNTGLFRYAQGQFTKGFMSSFSFTIFAMITDYKFHPYISSIKGESLKQKARQKADTIEELVKWSEKYLKNCENGYRFFYQQYVKSLKYNSFCLQSEVNNFLRKSKEEIQPKIPIGQDGQLISVNDKEFFNYVTSYFPEKISEGLIKRQIYKINEENFYFLQTVANSISKRGFNLKLLKEAYRNERRDLFGERVFRSLVFGKKAKDKQSNQKVANKMRKRRKISELKLIDQHLFLKKQNQHYAFIEVNLPHSLKTRQFEQGSIEQVLRQLTELRNSQSRQEIAYDERNMLVVLVHGFQASSYDMQVIRREVLRMLPVAMFLSSSCNQSDTKADIEVMGKKLAEQVKSYLHRFIENQREVILNFIGHSMGGIIARAALPHLKDFQKQFGFYFSLSSPHLGYLNGVDLKIKAGLWFMRKANKVLSLDQLSMQDKQSLKQTLLYKLSTEGHLRNFKKVILLSSSEDSYVPWHSARIEYYDGSESKIEKQMIENILGDQIVHRIDIHFDIETMKDLNSFIGRTAHINLLTQETILKLVSQAVPNLFDIKQL